MGWLSGKPLSSNSRWVQFSRAYRSESSLQNEDYSPLSARPVLSDLLESESKQCLGFERSREARYVSVVLPIYNEQSCIEETFNAVLDFAECHPFYCFIFVNDGSTDETATLLESRIAASQTFQIKLVSYGERRGKGYAVKRGIEVAEGDYLCFLDGDLAYSLEHLDGLFEQLKEFDVVIGCRNLVPGGVKGVRFSRRIAGKIFNILSRWLLGLKFNDMQAGLKGFRKQAAKEIFSKQKLTGFSFDAELIYLAKKQNYRVGEIPAVVASSHKKKISKVNLVQDSLHMLWDLLTIRLNDMLGRYD